MIVAKEIPAGRYDDWQNMLNHINRFGENDIIDGCCFDFGDGWEVGYHICDSYNGPYINIVLFKDGHEMACAEPHYWLEGTITIMFNGREFTVEVLRGY